jgi:uncharacterized protein YdaU (DUF1376 family)
VRRLNYYSHHIGDYARDTAHLTPLEDLAYRRMLDLYYASERPLPSNRQGLYRLLRLRTKEETKAVDSVLQEFFTEIDGSWHNKRADEEIAKWQSKAAKAKSSAAHRWHSEGNANASANAMRTHTEGNANQNQEPRTRVDARSRASRLEVIELPEAWRKFCVAERPDLTPDDAFSRFRDYWIAKPGKDGTKLDWQATWRNWVRNERRAEGKQQQGASW